MSRRSDRIKKLSEDNKKTLDSTRNRQHGVQVGNDSRGRGGDQVAVSTSVETTTSVDGIVKAARLKLTSRRRGKLHQILDMPLDVIMEICLSLQTKDILHLSRLSKAFRALFTSRTTQFIWRAARHNVPGLPPLPNDLTELAYANLLFDPHCHKCLIKNCSSVYWGCRVRLCKKCYDKLAICSDYYGCKFYHLFDATTKKLLKDHHLVDASVPLLCQLPDGTKVQYIPLLDSFVLAWKATPEADRKKFFEESQRSTSAIDKTVPALIEWHDSFKSARANELVDIRKARQTAIIQHLKDDDWGPELEYMVDSTFEWEFNNLPEVRKTQELTPRIWKNIQPRIVELMAKIRPHRLHRDHIRALYDRLTATAKVLKENLAESHDYELALRELVLCSRRFYDIISQGDSEFNAEGLRSTLEALALRHIEKRERKAKQALATLIREETGLKESADPFSLAIGSHFSCNDCHRVFTYRNAIRHNCLTSSQNRPDKQKWMSDAYLSAARDWLASHTRYRAPWSAEIYRHQFKKIAKVIELCGFDLNTATIEDLDKDVNLRIICTNHLRRGKYIPIMNWKTAAYQPRHSGCDDENPSFEIASEEYKAAVKNSEIEHFSKPHRLEAAKYCCARCSVKFLERQSKEAVFAHLKEEHGVMQAMKSDFIDEHEDDPVISPVYLIPQRCKGSNWPGDRHALRYLEYPGSNGSYLITYWPIVETVTTS
ncbi:hypothetical protein BDY19DRAFT_943117 [Irpex rosettiformis]|uniref:Uncharacterized protein n=1 Tax=Irpex rosettiformis TaxID=378272 RepID=A0ACB8U6K5_9APHY|nr:hypothetical protein BDY19DRAFT_943117 [Irpex rosettiformis]